MGEEELKVGMMTKRAQQKKSIGPTNYKERVFVLTRSKLSYYDGTISQRGKMKGSIPIDNIKFVGVIEDEALNRTSAFQIMHKDLYLYCCAKSADDRNSWINAIKNVCHERMCNILTYYHPSIFSNSKWQCCGKSEKDAKGCKQEVPVSTNDMAQSKGSGRPTGRKEVARNDSPPKPPPRPQQVPRVEIEVVALYDFAPQEAGDIKLIQGEYYTIVENFRMYWWKARDRYGHEGYVPANYVQDKQKDGLETKDWFQTDISRQRAEMLLLEDGCEGSFVIRSSSHKDVPYTLSVVSKCGKVNGNAIVKHYHIKQNINNEFYFTEKHAHLTVIELINYHQFNAGGLVTRLKQAPACFRTEPPMTHMFSNSQWEIDMRELQMERELGNGQFGVVKLALYRNKQYVAVKMMREGTMEEDSFIEEAEVMTRLHHKHLVQLYGVVTRQRPICIITEYMENGCLLDYIRNHKGLQDQPAQLLDMCYQVCDAMHYLEENNLIHRDLAARNCLVGKQLIIKVSDFGLTRFVLDDEYTSSLGSKFPIKWAAPEVLNYTKFSSKSDVWAFGILMWEIFSGGKMPYLGMGNGDVVEQVGQGYRLERPGHCPHDVYSIMKKCWELEPEKRPSFDNLISILIELLEKIQTIDYRRGGY
uniref:tyrosine-protein kinase TXK-like n=1 Tax=Styela clava TaxID=7725 RepID=UPI001939BD60|nr:tyrosine-protein kinase TXK-like [Styela clava]